MGAGVQISGVTYNTNGAQVINLSLGGSGACSQAEADAIAGANARGSTVVISAGNSGADAANYSPGNCPGVITVAANGIYSKRAFYSNYGSTVEIARSEEHTSELQSLMRISYAVFCLK